MANEQYLPLDTIVSVDQLPETISFISGGINTVFSNICFRDYFVSQNLKQAGTLHELVLASSADASVYGQPAGVFTLAIIYKHLA